MSANDNQAGEQPEAGQEAATPEAAEAERAAALEAEVGDLKDKLLRTLAEMENLRRRTERELADTRQYSVASFARDMLTVGDNLRRAIEAVPKDAAKADPALAALIEGVEVTERGLEQSLKKFGVKKVDAKGERFDPNIHQAIYEVENGELAPGTVAEVIQAGYVIGDRVLRPAFVAVAKQPAAAKTIEPETESQSDSD